MAQLEFSHPIETPLELFFFFLFEMGHLWSLMLDNGYLLYNPTIYQQLIVVHCFLVGFVILSLMECFFPQNSSEKF